MSDTTPKLSLPYILPSQAQKHVTHNEALQVLDAVTQLVLAETLTAPPASAVDGACYGVLSGATGEWVNQDGKIAVYQDGAWAYLKPLTGWRAYLASSGKFLVFDGSRWSDLPLPAEGLFSTLGVNASPDSTNRFSVSSDAALFNHAGNGCQLKLNKSAVTDTASLLYQTNWSGRAEIGLSGSDSLGIKVSGDGSNWTSALQISTDGIIDQPQRPYAQISYNVPTFNVSEGTTTGFNVINLNQGNFALSTALTNGYGSTIKIPASGIYLISLNIRITNSSNYSLKLIKSDGSGLLGQFFGTVSSFTSSEQSSLSSLTAGDEVMIIHSGSASFGYSSLCARLVMIRL
ncbi:DUF2793 domain-containing protein [Allorhizobium sp. BGMRC 0089]|uniref:DUF2793 domain-containing protein n=1 Tax=Allorhizobium sonneratiae TaxID=2934936 RepID=UPI00203487FF|nr:DUF2793 domain-containing protein [Allorhizobium sonneratiae]MCM2290996.1 DUF2793 domain-containing protein [Allorhizobium sonneratiae]